MVSKIARIFVSKIGPATGVRYRRWGGGDVDGGSVNAFLAAALTRVMRTAMSIPAVASASVLHSTSVGGSVVGVVRPL